ncbi:MAG: tyrosine--tRNA ligase [Patescibacteria group bacterium]
MISRMAVIIDEAQIRTFLTRRAEAVFPSLNQALTCFKKGKPLRIYWGIDPSRPEIHIGHTISLLWLKELAALGHKPILLIGDFTAQIGDPTGKDATRPALTEEQIRENMKTYLEQAEKIIPRENFDVEYNSKWLKPMSFEGVLKLASHLTVQQMIQRDMFQERLKQERPIYLHEFLYPLMQGFDSVALETDGELGGSDQTFNMLVGRSLERALIKKEKLVFTTPLLVNPNGKKMSKSEGEIIALTDEPQEIRRKILLFPDGYIKTIFTLCTEKDIAWIEEQAKKQEPRQLKEMLADELVRMYHGDEATTEAREPIEVPSGAPLAQSLKVWGATTTISAGKDIITSGGVTVNEKKEADWNYLPKAGDKIQVGKGKFYKVK